MAPDLLLLVVVAGLNVWAVHALRVDVPEPGEDALMDISMEWTTVLGKVPHGGGARDVCSMFEKPEAIPRSSVDPLTADEFARLPVSGVYDARFQSFFDKLRSGRNVKMVALGGSETAGVDCRETLAGGGVVAAYHCSWPARLQTALSALFPQSSVSLLNMAHGGTTTSVILGAIALLLRDVPGGPGQIDVIMVDTLVNDAYESKTWTNTGNLKPGEVVQTSYEALFRVLHDLAPQAMLVSVTAGCERCLRAAQYQRAVDAFYGVPLVDFADLVERTPETFWVPPGAGHPAWTSHQTMSEVIVGTWAFGFRDICGGAHLPQPTFPLGSLAAPGLLSHFKTCKAGESEYYAQDANGTQPTIVKGWRLFEDRPGKPGWISEGPGATMTFQLSFGAEPRLLFTYLQSYENIDFATLQMNKRSTTVVALDTAIKASQAHTRWFNARTTVGQTYENGLFGFGVNPYARHMTLTVTAPRGKFKVISVVSC